MPLKHPGGTTLPTLRIGGFALANAQSGFVSGRPPQVKSVTLDIVY